MTYHTIEKKLKQIDRNFYDFLKVHTQGKKAIIFVNTFTSQFLEHLLKRLKQYKSGIEIENKKVSLINAIYIDEIDKKIEIELSEIFLNIKDLK